MSLPFRNQDTEYKPMVYFDTNALNFLCDKFRGKSKKPFRNYEIPLSWPLIDEIECNSSFARTIELADFAWSISDRKVFLTANDLVALEVSSVLGNKEISVSDYYDSDQSYLIALNEARKGVTPIQTRIHLRTMIGEQKKKIQKWERIQRKKWLSIFSDEKSLPNDWHEIYILLKAERYFNQVLLGMIDAYGLSNLFRREDIMSLNHRDLPTLSIGIEFYVALQFIIDSQSKKQGKPDRGDLPDVQHAFYVGVCDYFVTDDPRMSYILIDLVDTKSSRIIGCRDFFKNFKNDR